MSVTDELLKNNERYAASFDKGTCPFPPPGTSPSWRAWTPASTSTSSWGWPRATPTSSGTPAAASPTMPSGRS